MPHFMRVPAVLLLSLVFCATATPALGAEQTTLASRATGASGTKGNAFSQSSTFSLSADGHAVAFQSTASNLHPDNADSVSDVFVRNLQTNVTTLVSRASGASGAKGNDYSLAPSTSADGRYVAFASAASNLHPDDADSLQDVFVRDLQTATTTLVSRATGASGAKGDASSQEPSISADGRYVVFVSAASNLHPDDPDSLQDVFVRDLQTDTTTLVSRDSGASGAKADNASLSPSVSADGRFVAFGSIASNLYPDDVNPFTETFVTHLQLMRRRW